MTSEPPQQRRFNFLTLLLALLAILSIGLAIPLTSAMKEQQRLQVHLAEINHAQYGLFDPNQWSKQIGELVDQRMGATQWSEGDLEKTEQAVTAMLYQLVGEARNNLQGVEGGFFRVGMNFCLNQFQEQVPSLAQQMTKHIADPNSQDQIKQLIQQQLNHLMASSFASVDRSMLIAISEHHGCELSEDCNTQLSLKIEQQQQTILPLLVAVLLLSIGVLMVSFLRPTALLRWHLIPAILACLALLVGGVMAPMLSIEAKISQFDVQLLGDAISFSNQILFYQNKSIIDVAALLLRSGELQLIFVSVLVVLFSVIFPLAKLLSSIWVGFGQPPSLIASFFALKSSKWSLADVLVVALFMTYLGFSGVIDRQLLPLVSNTDSLSILTTNGSQLEWGFTLFLAFCVSSFLLSLKLNNELNK